MSLLFRALPSARTLLSPSRASFTKLHSAPSVRHFSRTAATMVKEGDAIPSIELHEGNPGGKVDLSKVLATGKGVIIGVPAAFSPGCSNTHVPGYVNSEKTKDAGQVFVVSVNDVFVMKAWGATLDPSGGSKIRFLADPEGKWVKSLDLDFDASGMLGNFRAKRFALTTEDGKIKGVHVEPDNTGIDVSSVEKVLA